MSHYAEITNGKVTNVSVCDDPSFAEQMGWIGPIDTVTPEPGVGWSYDGTTWTPPTPPPPTPQQTAREQVRTLAATIPTQISAAQADAHTIASMVAGQAPTAEQIAALTRHANGWVTLLEGLSALVTALGMD